jgi:hypothetical protein
MIAFKCLLGISETFLRSLSSPQRKNCSSARCASAAVVCRDVDVFGTKNVFLNHIFKCKGACVTYRRSLDVMIGFIESLYSALAALHTLYFTVTHAIVLSIFTSRILTTDLQQSHCHCSTNEIFFEQSNSFLAISSQSA